MVGSRCRHLPYTESGKKTPPETAVFGPPAKDKRPDPGIIHQRGYIIADEELLFWHSSTYSSLRTPQWMSLVPLCGAFVSGEGMVIGVEYVREGG
jgi:hypothetical protein